MYRKVDYDIWKDRKYRALSKQPPSGQGLFLHLLIGKHTCILPGIILARPAEIFAYLGWPLNAHALGEGYPEGYPEPLAEGLGEGYPKGCHHGAAAMAELVDNGMVKVDSEGGLIWLPKALKRNPPPSPNHLKQWAKQWERVPDCDLKWLIYADWLSFMTSMGKGYGKPFREGFGEGLPKGYRKTSPKGLGEPENREQGTENRDTGSLPCPNSQASPASETPTAENLDPSEPKAKSKAKKPKPPPTATGVAVAQYLLASIHTHTPQYARTEAEMTSWAHTVDLAIRIDERTVQGLREVIDFAHRSKDDFWHGNLLSATKLRTQFDQLTIKARAAEKVKTDSGFSARELFEMSISGEDVKTPEELGMFDMSPPTEEPEPESDDDGGIAF